MSEASPSIRRGRRTDFTATMAVLAASGVPVPPPDRATLHRFRNIVADLGADLYVALVDGVVAGVVHVTYNRRLTTAARAQIDLLCVTPEHRRRGVGSALLRFAHKRALGRGCAFVAQDLAQDFAPDLASDPGDAAERLLARHGMQPEKRTWVASLLVPPAAAENADG
jgi:GNAT superfamily N-acetyltransferase